jgi:hypothetical protein
MSKVAVCILGAEINQEFYTLIQEKEPDCFDLIKQNDEYVAIAGRIISKLSIDQEQKSLNAPYLYDLDNIRNEIRSDFNHLDGNEPPTCQIFMIICDSDAIYYSRYSDPF